MQAIVEVHGLSKKFKDFVAVEDLSFTVNKGDVYGFLGQNGAGKSTSIRMILTLIEPTAGKVEIFGLDNRKHRADVLSRIGAVVEKPDLYKYISAIENLKLFAKLSGMSSTDKQLMEQLEMVGLQGRANDKVGTFSQGMKQRLGIAIALVHGPDLIVLDEPTNGLDPQGIADIRNLILLLSREMGKTIIISSHLLAEIEQVATRLLIIDKGKKLVEGSARELLDPSHTIVEIETTDKTKSEALLRNSIWKDTLQTPRNGNILLKLHGDQLHQLHAEMVGMGIGIVSSRSRNNLEDYFLQITTGTQHVSTYRN